MKITTYFLIAFMALMRLTSHAQINVVPDNIEFQVLKDLYDSLGGSLWTVKTNWPDANSWPSNATSAQFGTWYGISVVNGDITQISWGINNVRGRLPSSIRKLSRLKYLIIAGNHLTGEIPLAISELSQLQSLNLSGNQLTGSLPDEIGNLSNLTGLLLSGNTFSGELPPGLCRLTNLTYLELDQNRLSGEIPLWLGSLSHLKILWLSNNYFEGTLPEIFSNMHDLGDFRLSNTLVGGPLPSSLGVPGSPLFRIVLSANKFSGSIPQSWNNLTELTELYLDRNELGGELFAGNWLKLRAVDIHNNRFVGDFPAAMGFGICSINASNNYFTSIPDELLLRKSLIIVFFDNNDLSKIPDFSTYSNKVNLTLKLENNRLDFSQLERQVGKEIKSITQTPQKIIRDISTQTISIGEKLVINARSTGSGTSLIWEKLGPNGISWSTVTNDDDNVASTYTRNIAGTEDFGTYRWKSTSSIIPNLMIQSDPIVVKTSQSFILDNWSFQYKYDARNRMTHKKVPGADWVFMVYDDRDRLVMTQDGEQRKTNQWTVTKYDVLNRPVVTAIYTHGNYSSQEEMSSLINKNSFAESWSGSGISGYTNTLFPTTNLEILTVTYYDNYLFASGNPDIVYKNKELKDQYSFNSSGSFPFVTGMVTGTKIKVLDMPYYLTTANYYDDRGRVVQSVSENYDAGIDRLTTNYDFTGKILSTRTTHSVNNLHWQNVGLMQIEDNLLRRLSSTSYGGGSSVEFIPASGNGWAEATVTETTTARYWGLSDADPDRLPATIDYGFYMNVNVLQVFENNVIRQTMGGLQSGDKLRIERIDSKIRYYRNGSLLYTSNIPSTSQLRMDVSLATVNSTILNPILSTNYKAQTIFHEFDYDHAGRLIETRHSVNNSDTVVLVTHEYNEMGQLIDKKLYGKPDSHFSQSIDYSYNIRGWITSLNEIDSVDDDSDSDLYEVNLNYSKSLPGFNNTPLFNGNISSMQWRVNLGLTDTSKRAYNFQYDPMNRLIGSGENVFDGQWKNEDAFSERNIKYDLNGNILKLQRFASKGVLMDDLVYGYGSSGNASGNQLLKITDHGDTRTGFSENVDIYDDYTYDHNGNMISDNNKSINVRYNTLNLPAIVSKSTGESIQYFYDANGRKLSQLLKDDTGTPKKWASYHRDFIYEKDTLKYVNHEEGRVIMTSTEPEYQYHLKDHLGNVRVTFTTKKDIDESVATFETASADFLYYNEAVMINSEIFDHTDTATTHYSSRLNGKPDERYGLAKSLSVMPGDTINVHVFAKYLDNKIQTPQLKVLMDAIHDGTAPSGTFKDLGLIGSTGGVTPPLSLLFTTQPENDNDAPKAYLNWLIFDREYNLLDEGSLQITTSAAEHGQNGPHEELSKQLLIKEAGYVYLYLSNDNYAINSEVVEVYFDDFKVEHIKSPVIQSQDYYPFGLTFNQYSKEGSEPDKLKLFEGQEYIDDLSLNWNSFHYRNYQPDIGRFFNVDPLSDKYVYNSPYAFAENKLGLGIELEGLELLPLVTYTLEVNTPTARQPLFLDNPIKLTAETGTKTSKFTAEQLQNFARGNKIEAEQLAKHGLEKNYKPIEITDPKTGKIGRTIPDGLEHEGQATVEIKNVKQQGFTKQLRLQKAESNGNGFKPKLIINKEAKLTEPLKNAGFDIRLYQVIQVTPDATRFVPFYKNKLPFNDK